MRLRAGKDGDPNVGMLMICAELDATARDDLLRYRVEVFGDAEGIEVAGETGFIYQAMAKKGSLNPFWLS